MCHEIRIAAASAWFVVKVPGSWRKGIYLDIAATHCNTLPHTATHCKTDTFIIKELQGETEQAIHKQTHTHTDTDFIDNTPLDRSE